MAGLALGSVDLMGTPGSSFSVFALGTDSGTTWGNPAPIETQLRSFLQDGAVVVTSGYDNREVMIAVEVDGTDSLSLADAEAALFLELGKRSTLTYTPSDGFAPDTVFDVVTSSLEPLPDDLAEEMHGQANYMLRLVCLPFVRSAVLSSVAALGNGVDPPAATTVTVDDGTSTTGWSASLGALAVDAGAVRQTYTTVTTGDTTITETRTGSVALTTTPYLVVDRKVSFSGAGFGIALQPATGVGGGTLTLVATLPSPIAGYTREVYSGSGTYTALSFPATASVGSGAVIRQWVANIDRTDQLPPVTTTRQLSRSLTVGGSARTQGSLSVSHETSSLGTVMVYTRPDDGLGYYPPLRSYLTSAAGATDTTLVSAARNDPTTPMVYDIPYTSIPAGTLAIWARIRSTSSTAQTFTWTAQTRQNGADIGAAATGTKQVAYVGGSAWQVEQLASGITFPVLDMPLGTGATLRITIQQTTSTGSPTCALDEAWLFEMSAGRLTVVDCGTGTAANGGPSNRLWINAPTVTTPRWTIYRGFASDKSDAFFPSKIQSPPAHDFAPGVLMVFSVTTNALNAAVTWSGYNRWHTRAAS